MSLDARYILVYETVYEGQPWHEDIKYLSEKYGGEFTFFNGCRSIFWDKPKHTLSEEEFKKLFADQILERRDCELWDIVK